MADRFPLILNTSANQIQEIASGDNLDLTGNNISNAGVITATSFSGPIVAGAGTSNITAGIITAVTFKGDGDFFDIDVDGHTNLDNVNIAGVTTIGNSLFANGNLTISNAAPTITLTDSDADDYALQVNGGSFIIHDTTAGATRLSITDAGNVDINGDLDIDGHTNLDNVSIVGLATVSRTSGDGADPIFKVLHSNLSQGILFGYNTIAATGTNTNVDLRLESKGSGLVYIIDSLQAQAGINVTGNATVTGNLSVGGVLTYEDVTNVDSVGIVTARNGLKVTGGTSNFSGTSHFVGIARFNETIVGTARTAIKLTCTDESTDTTTYPLFVAATTGDQFPKTGTNLSFNSANGTLTATTFSGSGASLTSLPAANLTGTAAAINGSNITNVNADTVDGVHAAQFLRGDATSTFNCNGYNLGFDFDTSGRDSLNFSQGGSLRFQLVHSNSGNDIDIIKHGSAANIRIAGARILTTADEGTGNGLDADTVDGIHGGSFVRKDSTDNGATTIKVNDNDFIVQDTTDSTTNFIWRDHSANILYVGTGNAVVTARSHVIPQADDTYNLGANGTRWANVYVNDLQLSNKGKSNDVDGTWGDWTLQEGETEVFMINNRTGKKYAMMLKEVS